jgi:hypothetical protein
MVGSEARILPSSLITPFSIGTFRSQRSSTRFDSSRPRLGRVLKIRVCSQPKQ